MRASHAGSALHSTVHVCVGHPSVLLLRNTSCFSTSSLLLSSARAARHSRLVGDDVSVEDWTSSPDRLILPGAPGPALLSLMEGTRSSDSPALHAGQAPSRSLIPLPGPERPSVRQTNHAGLPTPDPDSLSSKPNRKSQIPSFGIFLAQIQGSIPDSRPE